MVAQTNPTNGVTPSNGNGPIQKMPVRGSGRYSGDPTADWIRSSGARYLRVYWHDYSSSARCRVIPIRRIWEHFEKSQDAADPKPFMVSVAKPSLGMLANDHMAPGVTGTGVYMLQTDWATLRHGPAPEHISCRGYFHEEDGSKAILCPRGILSRVVNKAAAAGLTFLVGFEVEFTVLERTQSIDKFRMLSTDGHGWSQARALATWGAEGSVGTVMDEILSALEKADISVEQFHTESAPGQYEIVLSPQTPLEACDTLLHTRQVVESAAARHGLRVTLHPRPFPNLVGNGAHTHMSITSADGDLPRVYERFYGGILSHFRAVFALTNSHPTSYERMVDSLWSGGRWVTWGVHNKEAPLRQCKDSHWEVKVMDGIANPYLALAALIAAGSAGAELTWRDCAVDPAKLSSVERAALGITTQLPRTLDEALEALEGDDVMVESLGREIVERYVTVKKAEMKLLESIPEDMRRTWVFERY
ncbi:hypothetical protein F5Y10DRAFT_81779 [Nemania abortiva]|nr:hypothetical protein F5Y10DRAFT_81779 [Nemania abortiva]